VVSEGGKAAAAAPVVLVVEDEPTLCDALRELLLAAGYGVECAMDGGTALGCILAGGMDLVLLDIMLPSMDGLEICRRVRERERGVYVPIIVLTALGSADQRHAAFEAGADDHVTKPFNAGDLLDRVGVWTRMRQRLATAQTERLRAVADRLQALGAARLEGVQLTARELAHRLGNQLWTVASVLELQQLQADALPESIQALIAQALPAIEGAVDDLAKLQQVVRVETRETPLGPALDLDRSTERGKNG
jgi:DNA-binding response OmpR family regulator